METLKDRITKYLVPETWADVVAHTLTDDELNKLRHWFDSIPDFTLWTANTVYHVENDADDGDYITCVDRNPPNKKENPS